MSRKFQQPIVQMLMRYLDNLDHKLDEIDSSEDIVMKELVQFSGDTPFRKVIDHLKKVTEENERNRSKKDVQQEIVDATIGTKSLTKYFLRLI